MPHRLPSLGLNKPNLEPPDRVLMRDASDKARSLNVVSGGAASIVLNDLTLEILRDRRNSARKRRKTIVSRMLIVADVLALLLAYVIAEAFFEAISRPS